MKKIILLFFISIILTPLVKAQSSFYYLQFRIVDNNIELIQSSEKSGFLKRKRITQPVSGNNLRIDLTNGTENSEFTDYIKDPRFGYLEFMDVNGELKSVPTEPPYSFIVRVPKLEKAQNLKIRAFNPNQTLNKPEMVLSFDIDLGAL